ncbi:MAG: ribonucleotide reductase, beta subunit [Actinomycetia bacterium]|nr:ribonucleotide reductase, beta subunit [Actinomycetes bacterium]
MSEPAAGGKIQETDIGRYRSTRGLDYESVPWKLWEKSKKLFWDPADLDFSQDAIDWQEMTEEERTLVALSARGFMVGEEAVTLDIVPLLRCMSDLGRLEDTMYLSMFAMEEAKHTEMFRRWFDAVGLDPASLDDLVLARQAAVSEQQGERRAGIFDGALTKVMRRLDTDKSPQAILDASIIYNQLVEGVMAIAGYQRWERTFRRLGKLPGLEAGLKLTQRDERRHIAYGTYLARRVLAENPELWEWLEKRWAKLTAGFSGGGYDAAGPQNTGPQTAVQREDAELMEHYQRLSKRRLEALAVARTMNVTEVDASAIEAFEPEELQHA